MGLVCFRMIGPNRFSEHLLQSINESGQLHMVPSSINGKYMIRFAVCAENANEGDITYAWKSRKFEDLDFEIALKNAAFYKKVDLSTELNFWKLLCRARYFIFWTLCSTSGALSLQLHMIALRVSVTIPGWSSRGNQRWSALSLSSSALIFAESGLFRTEHFRAEQYCFRQNQLWTSLIQRWLTLNDSWYWHM